MADSRVAVVIPIHRQPSLLLDAVESALRQRADFDYRIVLVNDGCPFSETDEVCRAYARRHPDRIRYVRTAHGGVSAARNTGANLARQLWPSIEAVQFLNAGDRLGPRALQQGLEALRSDPEHAWSCSGDGHVSLLESLACHNAPHTTMVGRRVLDRGLRFDESVNSGHEDWDFWMRCMGDGMRGVRVPTMDVQRRDHNNGADSRRHHRQHDAWCTPRMALELEQAESPRFAIHLIDENRTVLTSDPGRQERFIPLNELSGRLARAIANPRESKFPPFFVVTSGAFLRIAQQGRFASGLLWLMQYELARSTSAVMGVTLTEHPGTEYAYDVLPPAAPSADSPIRADMAILRTQTLLDFLAKSDRLELRRFLRTPSDAGLRCREVRYTHPDISSEPRLDALEGLAALVYETGPRLEKEKRVCLTHGMEFPSSNGDPSEPSRQLFKSGPLFPKLLDQSKVHIGFVLPICRFGGADRATMNLGRETRRRGWTPHLFVVNSGTAQLLAEFRDTFETITVVEPWELWQPDGLLGLLGTMDVVVNNLSTPTNDVFKLLRRHGIKTICHLHSVIVSTNEMPSGQAYEMLRHEAEVDGVIVISRKLENWCGAWGIPREKLIYAPNAPSFEVSDVIVRTTMAVRAERAVGRPLNILYLGRFDWEKGMDRLLALHERARIESLPVAWQIVGGRVCGLETTTDRDFEPIRSVMSPPVLTRSGLTRLYAWADVVIMVSRFEGVPLTLLEAQRLGCVVMSTRVGAIQEIVESGRTGFLFSNELDTPALVDQMMACLRDLHVDRGRLMEVARTGAELRRKTTWTVNTQPFADFVISHLALAGEKTP